MAFRHHSASASASASSSSLVRVGGDFDLLSAATTFAAASEWDWSRLLAVGESIPAYRYSATFLSTLRTNIHLSTTSDLCSYPPTPTMPAFSTSSSLHQNPSASTPSQSRKPTATPSASNPTPQSSSSASDPSSAANIPTLSTYPTASPSDRTSALHLVADSIAQQRQLTSYALITHPYPLSAVILALGVLSQYLDPSVFVTTAAGCIMALLVLVRWIASPYLARAEGINFGWLEGPPSLQVLGAGGKKRRGGGHSRSSSTGSNSSTTGGNVEPAVPLASSSSSSSTGNKAANQGGRRARNNSNGSRDRDGGGGGNGVENVVVVTKWGEEEIIGALVMRVLRREGRAVIRAWTVKGRYRGHGVGRGLLEEGVRLARGKGCVVAKDGGKGAVDFDWGGHANSYKVLPEMFNKGFERREKQARKVLEEVLAEQR